MVEEGVRTVELRADFYREGVGKIFFIICSIIIAIVLFALLSFYLYFNQPAPIVFRVDKDWHVQPEVSLDKAYLATPEVLQWVSNAIPAIFRYDFLRYNDQLKTASQYFTTDGWKGFLNQLNNYANYNNVQNNKLFLNGVLSSAPFVVNQGVLGGRYAWWVQTTVDLNYESFNKKYTQTLTLQLLVVRVPLSNNLAGVGINNVIVTA